jgi:hypothetical protein
VVSFHLRLKSCQIADQADWLCGSYNVCIPVYINLPSEECVLIRIPLPYKVGEENIPGNIEEILRCEVATYIWIRENCPDVPIPTLYGFAFPNGQTVCERILSICLGRLILLLSLLRRAASIFLLGGIGASRKPCDHGWGTPKPAHISVPGTRMCRKLDI